MYNQIYSITCVLLGIHAMNQSIMNKEVPGGFPLHEFYSRGGCIVSPREGRTETRR